MFSVNLSERIEMAIEVLRAVGRDDDCQVRVLVNGKVRNAYRGPVEHCRRLAQALADHDMEEVRALVRAERIERRGEAAGGEASSWKPSQLPERAERLCQFVTWSTGAVRADRIERFEVREERATLLLENGNQLRIPAEDIADVRRQLGLGAACAATEGKRNEWKEEGYLYHARCVEVGCPVLRDGDVSIAVRIGRVVRQITPEAANRLAAQLKEAVAQKAETSQATSNTDQQHVARKCTSVSSRANGAGEIVTFHFNDGSRENWDVFGKLTITDVSLASRAPDRLRAEFRHRPGVALRGADGLRDVAANVAAFREASDVSTFPSQIPEQYADASVRCVLGPDDDGRYGFGFDFAAIGCGTVRVRLPAAEVEKLLTWIRYPHRSQSLTSIGIPSFEASRGTDVNNRSPLVPMQCHVSMAGIQEQACSASRAPIGFSTDDASRKRPHG